MQSKRRRTRWYSAAFAAMVLLMLLAVPLLQGVPFRELPQYFAGLLNPPEDSPTLAAPAGEAAVYFLDVGQADCTAVLLPSGKTMVIDAGNNADGPLVCKALQSLGISRIDYLIATHPHEDHIGGIDNVIRSFPVGAFYMPRVAENQTPTTKTYESVLTAASETGLKIKQAKAGTVLLEEEGIKITLLGPVLEAYDGLNSYSAVVRLQIGECSFLFMGDAEADAEADILAQKSTVKSDVLKAGHHGSSTSTSGAFLKAVSPRTVILSCGKDNSYGHPHRETLDMLAAGNISVYRTDQDATIAAFCDGKSIRFQTGLSSWDGNSP